MDTPRNANAGAGVSPGVNDVAEFQPIIRVRYHLFCEVLQNPIKRKKKQQKSICPKKSSSQQPYMR